MKWGEKLFGSKDECLQYLYQIVNQLAGGVLVLDGKDVTLPDDLHLEYKVKYAEDPGETKFSLKIAWPNDIPLEEIPEEEFGEEVVWAAPPVAEAPAETVATEVPGPAADNPSETAVGEQAEEEQPV